MVVSTRRQRISILRLRASFEGVMDREQVPFKYKMTARDCHPITAGATLYDMFGGSLVSDYMPLFRESRTHGQQRVLSSGQPTPKSWHIITQDGSVRPHECLLLHTEQPDSRRWFGK